MCGVIAYAGKNANKKVIEGLKKLEYRGYDSWGIAYLNDKINVLKRVGRVSSYNSKLPYTMSAIGHTRWATHGEVKEKNAHPHLDSKRNLAVVHNGIIENYAELKKQMDVEFESDTDTEVFAQMLSSEPLREAFSKVEGRNAFVIMRKTGEICGIKKGSPLVYGKSEKGHFLSSDISAILAHTNKVHFMEDGELIVVGKNATLYSPDGDQQHLKLHKLDWSPGKPDKAGFDHYMLKEIHEQSHVLKNVINKIPRLKTKKILFVGCGTSGNVAKMAQYIFPNSRHYATLGSEYHLYKPVIDKDCLVVAISQSGETADTLEVVEYAREKGARVLSIVNVPGSTMSRFSDYTININAGVEKAVASTKATLNQIAAIAMLADPSKECANEILTASQAIQRVLLKKEKIRKLALEIKNKKDIYLIGRGISYPVAQEGAVKIQEVSYIHAEGLAGGELKHYALALVERGTPVIVIAPKDRTFSDIISNAVEAHSRGGYIIGISPENHDVFDCHIKIPDIDISPLVTLVPLQLLAYYLSILKGHDPDYPRNLAKSVTVK